MFLCNFLSYLENSNNNNNLLRKFNVNSNANIS